MANTLKLEIVTPEAKIYSEDVEMVTLPGAEGEWHLPDARALMTQVIAGEVMCGKGAISITLQWGKVSWR